MQAVTEAVETAKELAAARERKAAAAEAQAQAAQQLVDATELKIAAAEKKAEEHANMAAELRGQVRGPPALVALGDVVRVEEADARQLRCVSWRVRRAMNERGEWQRGG